MDEIKQRVENEKLDLDIKIDHLGRFIDSLKIGELDDTQQGLLRAQLAVMQAYSVILQARLQYW